MKKPQPIRSILEKTIRSLEIDVPLKTYSILGAWSEIVGESVAAHSQPHSIRNRILFVDVKLSCVQPLYADDATPIAVRFAHWSSV